MIPLRQKALLFLKGVVAHIAVANIGGITLDLGFSRGKDLLGTEFVVIFLGVDVHKKVDKVYLDKMSWAKKSLNNIASAGIFASDRSIREYADRIWGLKRIK